MKARTCGSHAWLLLGSHRTLIRSKAFYICSYVSLNTCSFQGFNFHSFLWGESKRRSWNVILTRYDQFLWSILILLSCWFSHIYPKLSILPRFYFHDALEQLKPNFHTNFCFKRVLGFVIEYAWISKLLRDAALTWRPREQSCRLKKITYFRKCCYLNSSCIRKSISLMFMSFSKNKFTLL